jgi:hypothetical protein
MALSKALRNIVSNEETLRKLLVLEKQRRGVPQEQLIFLGMANVAGYKWCAKQALFKSRENESMVFASYLLDRILYAERLGLIDSLPRKTKALLDIGDEITLEDVETLLKKEAPSPVRFDATVTDVQGQKMMVINPDLSSSQRVYYEALAMKQGIPVVSSNEVPPELRGMMLETSQSEGYPTIRWNFPWDTYVVVGVPDGITDTFVYEFKTTRNGFLQGFQKPVALVQADLYGLFFRRGIKRVQIYVLDDQETKTWEEAVDKESAESLLKDFARATTGWEPPSPRPWKCKRCKFMPMCKPGAHP